jgi:hypothetical protein
MLYGREYDPTNVPPPQGFHFTAPARPKCSVTFRATGSSGSKVDAMHVDGKLVRARGIDLLLTDYLNEWLDELYASRLLRFYTADLPEGVHPMVEEAERSLGAGELVIDGHEMEHLQLHVEFGVEIIRPAVISDFEVATRGRVVRLAKVKIRDIAIDTSFVTTITG